MDTARSRSEKEEAWEASRWADMFPESMTPKTISRAGMAARTPFFAMPPSSGRGMASPQQRLMRAITPKAMGR